MYNYQVDNYHNTSIGYIEIYGEPGVSMIAQRESCNNDDDENNIEMDIIRIIWRWLKIATTSHDEDVPSERHFRSNHIAR